MMIMVVLCQKAGSLAFSPPGDEVARGRFEPATLRLQVTEHTPVKYHRIVLGINSL